MEVVGVDDFSHGAANVPFLGDARLIKGALTNATFLAGVFSRYKFDVVYHLPYQPGLAAEAMPSATVYSQDLVRRPP